MSGKIEELEGVKDGLKEKFDAKQIAYFKEKDEPLRLGKSNENLRIAVEHLKSDLDGLKRETETLEKHKAAEDDVHEKNSDLLDNLKEESSKKNKDF